MNDALIGGLLAIVGAVIDAVAGIVGSSIERRHQELYEARLLKTERFYDIYSALIEGTWVMEDATSYGRWAVTRLSEFGVRVPGGSQRKRLFRREIRALRLFRSGRFLRLTANAARGTLTLSARVGVGLAVRDVWFVIGSEQRKPATMRSSACWRRWALGCCTRTTGMLIVRHDLPVLRSTNCSVPASRCG